MASVPISKFLILPRRRRAYSLEEARARHSDLLNTFKTRRLQAIQVAVQER